MKACAVGLSACPECNATFTPEGAILVHRRVDISVAVAIPDGLVTPVVRNADQKSVVAIATEVRELAARALEAKKAEAGRDARGTFSISNLGMFGIDSFAAVINPPEGAILAVGQVRDVPVVVDGAVVPGKKLALTLSMRSPGDRRSGRRRVPRGASGRSSSIRCASLPDRKEGRACGRAAAKAASGSRSARPLRRSLSVSHDAPAREASFSGAGLDPPVERGPARGVLALRAPLAGRVRITGGTFEMGSSAREMFAALRLLREPDVESSLPTKQVDLRAPLRRGRRKERAPLRSGKRTRSRLRTFEIDRTEVRVADYARCVVAGRCVAPGFVPGDPRFDLPGLPP